MESPFYREISSLYERIRKVEDELKANKKQIAKNEEHISFLEKTLEEI